MQHATCFRVCGLRGPRPDRWEGAWSLVTSPAHARFSPSAGRDLDADSWRPRVPAASIAGKLAGHPDVEAKARRFRNPICSSFVLSSAARSGAASKPGKWQCNEPWISCFVSMLLRLPVAVSPMFCRQSPSFGAIV